MPGNEWSTVGYMRDLFVVTSPSAAAADAFRQAMEGADRTLKRASIDRDWQDLINGI